METMQALQGLLLGKRAEKGSSQDKKRKEKEKRKSKLRQDSEKNGKTSNRPDALVGRVGRVQSPLSDIISVGNCERE